MGEKPQPSPEELGIEDNMENREKRPDSKVVLSFFRHAEKEKHEEGISFEDMLQRDPEINLTPKGRKEAIEAGEKYRETNFSLEQSVAFGSPRKRTQETSALVMAGNEEEITGEESVEELEKILGRGRRYGSKLGIDQRLEAVRMTGNQDYADALMKAYREGRILDWFVHESDALARKLGDKQDTTYTKAARGVAELVKKYVAVSERFNILVKEKKYSDTLQRFFGTHELIGESFLAKIIEITKGVDERDKFIEALDGKPFGYTEGFQIKVENSKESAFPKLKIKYIKRKEGGVEIFRFEEVVHINVIDTLTWPEEENGNT